jgi:hypothetical protein
LVAQWLLLLVVLLMPGLVHFGEKAGEMTRAPPKELSPDELNKLLNRMLPAMPDPDSK